MGTHWWGSRLAAVLVVAAVVAACGSSSSSNSPAGSPASAGSLGPSAVASGAATQSPAGGQASADPVVADASAALAGLTSYQFDVTMTGGSYAAVMAPDGIRGTVVNNPGFAVQFTYVDVEIIQTQDKIWQKNGASWDLANAAYPNGKTTFDSFGPPVLLAHDFTPFVAYYTQVGDAVVENVSTTHYTCNPNALGYFSGVYGFSGDATVSADVWIAKSGGYPVKFEIKASGADEFDLLVLVTKANDPANVVDVPAS